MSQKTWLMLDFEVQIYHTLMRKILTRWLPGYNIFVLGNRPKTSSFWLPYPQHSSSVNCARELLKPSKDLASPLFCTGKVLVVGFCE